MTVLYAIERHDQLLHLWRMQNTRDLKIVHIDFHCDMRGLLVNRQIQRAYFISSLKRIDEGNFLTHAIIEGRVRGICWIHDTPGGRQFDVGTVKYTTDLTAKPFLWLWTSKKNDGIPVHYKVITWPDWSGINAGEFLDIDWDFFASKEYPRSSIESRVESFFNIDFKNKPEMISVCYSERYSHPSRRQFESFILRIASIFEAEIIHIPLSEQWEQKTATMHSTNIRMKLFYWCRYQIRHLHYEGTLWLRKKGIY